MSQRLIILILICYGVNIQLTASHLMGGTLGYEYHGLQANGKYRYKVTLVTYIDCGPNSEIPYAEYPIKVGIYEHDITNPTNNKNLTDSVLLFIDDTTVYIPFLPPGCNIGENSCIIQAQYSGWIDLPYSIHGYYLFYERCCRNISIINLQPNGSDGFLSFIPPTNIENSSPVFLYPPIPFLCVNDTITIFNTATDADGDSLVYGFTTPYNGFANGSNPNPPIPNPVLSWPVPLVDYVPGFNSLNPFNFFGNATIQATNGISTYFSMQQGTYVVGILVMEYRNGSIISTNVRDLQLLFNNCPNNHPPELVENFQTNYFVNVGDTLCFPITFQDVEGDSVFIENHGSIFDTALVNPSPLFTITTIDSNRSSANFCWVPPCDLDTGLYEFYIKSYDNGCPPKENYEFYSIRLIPPDKPNLFGSDSSCKEMDSVLYWMMVDNGYLYNWDVVNGIVDINHGDTVIVSWGIGDTGWVFVDVLTAGGCFVKRDSIEVTLIDIPLITAMPEDTVCRFDTLMLSATSLNPYYWYPENDIINPQSGNVYAIINQSGWYFVAGLPGQLCPPSDSVYITTLELPDISGIASDSMICKGDTISLIGSGVSELHWYPENWIQEPDSAYTLAIPDNNGLIILLGIDSNGCKNYDSIEIYIHPSPPLQIEGNLQVCLGDTAFIEVTGGVNYIWSPSAYLNPISGNTTMAIVQNNAPINLFVTDSFGCTMDTTFWIEVNSLPIPAFTIDTISISCEGAAFKFNNSSNHSDYFYWNFSGISYSTDISPSQIFPFGNTFVIELTAYNLLGCKSTLIDTIITDSIQNLLVFNHVNVFTPDDNGINDVLDFSLPNHFAPCTKVFVYDRWGVLVFESDDSLDAWDGKFHGKNVPEGIYYWIVEINGIKQMGFVHLFE